MNEVLNRITGKRILVAGDVMLDRYWWGSVGRISPEAPVPIVDLHHASLVAGGAANVAANIAGLGAVPVLIGVYGDDDESRLVDTVLTQAGVSASSLVKAPGRQTTIKTRIVAHSQHVVRIDQETSEPIDGPAEAQVLAMLPDKLDGVDAILISDYAKGFLSIAILSALISTASARKIPVIVDPKGRDFAKYAGSDVVTPNRREAAEAAGIDDSAGSTLDSGPRLLRELRSKALLVTEGENGMTLFEDNGQTTHFDPVAQDVYDVTGAGDTVIAVFTACVAAGWSYVEAARLANQAAGIVVAHVGTTRITRELLLLPSEQIVDRTVT